MRSVQPPRWPQPDPILLPIAEIQRAVIAVPSCPDCSSRHLLHIEPGPDGLPDWRVILGHSTTCPKEGR